MKAPYVESSVYMCWVAEGLSHQSSDCDDTDSSINTSAAEICDGVDNDCDGDIDDEDSSVDLSTGTTYYQDSDEDGFGDINNTFSGTRAPLSSLEQFDIKQLIRIKPKYLLIFIIP